MKGVTLSVRVETATQHTVRPYVTLLGTTEPYRESTVASEIEGLVVDYSIRLGQRVKKGQVLAKVETKPLRLDLKSAQAALAEANENHKNALSELERVEELFKKKSIADRTYDDALFKANAIKQRISALETRIEAIQYDIGKCVIRAPLSGFVVEEHTQIGQWLEKGGPVVTLVDIDPALITVPVPDRYVRYVKPGQSVELEFEFMEGKGKRQGVVRDVIPLGNEKARTFPVQITVSNEDFAILAGMSSSVKFPVGEPTVHTLVNKDALVTNSDRYHLFKVNDGKAHLVPVKKGQAYGSYIVVEGDLVPGQIVVVEGNERLRPGQAVSVQQPSNK